MLQRRDEASPSSQQQEASASSREAERYNHGRVTAPELERLHDALQQKEEQLASYQETISQLEAIRDR